MTAGDMIKPTLPNRKPLTRERLLRDQELHAARPASRQAVILFLGLTFVWVAVLWMAVFGSRPHTYLLVLVGTYTVGVLSGTGLSGFILRRSVAPQPASTVDEPIDAEVRTIS